MTQKVMLITGGNNGFGLVTAREIAAKNYKVVLIVRNQQRGERAQQKIFEATGNKPQLILADLSLQAQVKRAAAEFRTSNERLDVLFNNAGFAWSKRELTSEGFEQTFALNYLAYFTLTLKLIDMLVEAAPARIVNTSSEAHRWEDISIDNLQGEKRFSKRFSPLPLMYGYTNLMRIMFTYELAERLKNASVTANTFCPGFVPVERTGQSKFFNGMSKLLAKTGRGRSAEHAAKLMVYLASDPEAAKLNGTYHESDVLMNSAEQSYDTTIRQQLWDETLRLAGYQTDPLTAAMAQTNL